MFAIWIKDYFSEDYIKLDLFQTGTETILMKSQLSNLEKPSNVFSDVSNSFSVPSTPHNNKALRHWYDRDIVTNFNANINIPAYTEIGSIPYRWGTLSLEAGQMDTNKPKNYKVTFYSKNRQLSDLFGNDTIDRLDYDSSGIKQWNTLGQFDFLDTYANFYSSLSSPTFQSGNVFTPLIGLCNRDWEYGSNNVFDIGSLTYSVTNRELLYAFRVKNIIDGIQTKYGITFDSTFFSEAHFQKLFIWLNSDKNNSGNLNQTLLNFTTGNLDQLGFDYTTDTWIYYSTVQTDRMAYKIWCDPDVLDVPYNIIVKDASNNVVQRIECDGGNLESEVFLVPYFGGAYNINYRFFIECDRSINYDVELLLRKKNFLGGNFDRNGHSISGIVDTFSISDKIPKMKVNDFLTGIMKEFKLIIRPISTTEFYIDTLDNYYALGNIIPIGKFTNIESVDFKRPDVYTNIIFKYLKTNNVLGKKFRELQDPVNDELGYGDLKATYDLDNKKELKVELPFENMLFERMVTATSSVYPTNTTNIIFGQSSALNSEGTNLEINNSGPILFYNNGTYSCGSFSVAFKYNNATASYVNTLINMGNTDNIDSTLVTTSLNWGAEIDPWHQQIIYPCLYLNYWSRWFNSIYDLRQMKWSYKARLPIRYINEIGLNDSLIIGSKRYRIEDMTVNLINGDTTFNLFIDTDVYLGIPTDL